MNRIGYYWHIKLILLGYEEVTLDDLFQEVSDNLISAEVSPVQIGELRTAELQGVPKPAHNTTY